MKNSWHFFGYSVLAFVFVPLSALSLFGPKQASATLQWDPSRDKRVVNYRIYYADVTGRKAAKAKSFDVGQATHGIVSNLVAGHTYYFVVSALDAKRHESSPSNLVKYVAGSQLSNSK